MNIELIFPEEKYHHVITVGVIDQNLKNQHRY